MTWRDYWNSDTPIYVNERHKALHYRLVAGDIAALVTSPESVVLDHGCGEALSADLVAAKAARLYLCDAAPLVRERLTRRFAGQCKVAVLAPEDVASLGETTLDLVMVNSLLQYLGRQELDQLLGLWRAKLKPEGRLVIADVIPPDVGALTDARALLSFAWSGGFLGAALLGLVRTAFSDYRTLRKTLGLSRYTQAEMIDILRGAGFAVERRAANIGHNPARMTFVATPAA
jgi:SAM-dependent methyltransferase